MMNLIQMEAELAMTLAEFGSSAMSCGITTSANAATSDPSTVAM